MKKRNEKELHAADDLDGDVPGDAFPKGHAHAADLTQERGLAGDFLDDRGFAKTHFPKALTGVGLGIQRAYTTGGTRGELGEGHARTLKARIKVHGRASYD